MKRRLFYLLFLSALAVVGWFDPLTAAYGGVLAVTIASGQEATTTVLSNKRVIEMSSKISLLEPSSYPLLVLLKRLSKQEAGNEKFEWLVDELIPHIDAINYTTDSASDVGTVTVDNADYFMAGDIIKNLTTGEQMYVTAVSGNDLAVTRGYGETAADTLSDNDPIWRIGNTANEGGLSPAAKTTKEVAKFNYTQHFRHSVDLTGRLMNSRLYGGSHLRQKRKQRGIEHMKEMELAFWFGERKLDTTNKRSTTRGIDGFITTNVTSQQTLTEAEWETFLRTGFRYGPKEKWFFGSPLLIGGVSQWARGKLKTVPSDKTYGIAVTKYLSPHGTVMLVSHPLFEGTGGSTKRYSGYGFLLDMNQIKYRFFRNRDTKLFTNIQENDRDGRKDEYRTDAGLELRNERFHSKINTVQAFA